MMPTQQQNRLVLALLVLLQASGARVAAQENAQVSRESVAAALRHQETLLQSCECRFEVLQGATPPAMVPLIRRVAKGSEKVIRQFSYGEKEVRRLSTAAHWWRKGEKERLEITPLFPNATKDATAVAFDGNVVRSLSQSQGTPRARIETLDKSKWHLSYRTHPFSMLYEHSYMPLSEMIRKGHDFRAAFEKVNGTPCLRVYVRHPTFTDGAAVNLLFDSAYRLLEREHIHSFMVEGKRVPRANSKWVFSHYDSFPDASGEKIWFPRKAVQHFYMGKLPDGRLVEYTSETMSIKEIRFNIDIPDEQFVLSLPNEAEVFDGVTGQGWLPPGTSPPVWVDPPHPSSRFWLWIGIGASAALLILLGIFWLRRRRAAHP